MIKQTVTDLISQEDMINWMKGQMILINSPTGTGKSYFITNSLKKYCEDNNKTILFLTNRVLLKEQFQEELKENNEKETITIKNYQQIEASILNKKLIDSYDFIVADEVHYFFCDSLFNRKTSLSFNWLFNNTNSIRVLLSATSNFLRKYLEENLKLELTKYEIKTDYKYIDNLYFYEDDKVIKKMLIELPEKEKAIYFCGSSKAYKTSQELQDVDFICSKRNNTYSVHSNEETKDNIIEEQSFDSKILCTTSVLDNGINLKDRQIKHIVIDIFDIDTLQQCLGRKRVLDENDRINVYIKNFKGRAINTLKNSYSKAIEQANYLKQYGKIALTDKYYKEKLSETIDIVNDGENIDFKINEMMYYKALDGVDKCTQMADKNDKSYMEFVLERIDVEMDKVKILEDEYDAITLEDKLDKLVGIKMFDEDKENFMEFIRNDLFNGVKSRYGTIKVDTVNGFFRDNEYPYELESKKETSRKSNKYKKMFWILSKKVYEL